MHVLLIVICNIKTIHYNLDKKIGSHISMRSLNLILALPTFPGRLQPSIIGALDFTSVFEMGTGVSPKLYTPEIF